MSLVNDTWEEGPVDYDIYRSHESFWMKYSNLSLFETYDRDTILNIISGLNETQRVQYLVTLYNLDPNLRWDTPRYYSFFYKLIGTFFQTIIFLVGESKLYSHNIVPQNTTWQHKSPLFRPSPLPPFFILFSHRISYWRNKQE